MLLKEVLSPESGKLAALAQYLSDRATDTGAIEPVAINTFLSMAHNMGVIITVDQLRDLSQQPPLDNLIHNVTNNEVVFKGAGQSDAEVDTMTVDQAKDTVEKMAKRALPNDLK